MKVETNKCKLLLIEDHKVTCNRFKKAIEKEGFEVFVANDGEEGINIFNSNDIEIIISDYHLPKKTGLEIMHMVLSKRPNVAFVLVTGHGDQKFAMDAINKGALDYIKKPIDLEQVLSTLERFKERKKLNATITPLPTILVVEDDEIARNSFVRELKNHKYHVLFGSNGLEGLNIFKQNKIDIIVTDLNMPEMSGICLIKEVRELSDDPEIIIISGYGDEEETIKALRFGAFAYLKKPFNIDELLVVVEKAIEKQTLKRNLMFRNQDFTKMKELLLKSSNNNNL